MSGIVDGVGAAVAPAERTEIGHHAVLRDERTYPAAGSTGPSHHLSGIVDAKGIAIIPAERAEIGHHAIYHYESAGAAAGRIGVAHDLSDIVDAGDNVKGAEIGNRVANCRVSV